MNPRRSQPPSAAVVAASAVGLLRLALLTLAVRDRWEQARTGARGWLLLRRKGDLRRRPLEWRRTLGQRLEELRRELERGPSAGEAEVAGSGGRGAAPTDGGP